MSRKYSKELHNKSSLINSACWGRSESPSTLDSSAAKISKKLGTVTSFFSVSMVFPSKN